MGRCVSGALFCTSCLWLPQFQFITQQLLGNPLSSPPYECPYQQSWGAKSQQNSANPFLLWTKIRVTSSEDEESTEEHNSGAKRLLQTERSKVVGGSLTKLGEMEERRIQRKARIEAERTHNTELL